MLETLGIGSYGKVKKCRDSKTQELFAMKIIKRGKVKKREVNDAMSGIGAVIETEMNCLTKVDHINIIKLHEIIDDPRTDKVYLIMDYLPGGSLKDKLEESENGFDIELTRKYFRGLISSIHYCHEVQNISHRDIKPENILLGKFDKVKLCDFGVSEFFKSTNDLLSGATKGTYLFMAPEMVDTTRKKKG